MDTLSELVTNHSLAIVVALLVIAIILFMQNKLRMDVIALIVLLGFSLSGILTTQEVFAGFSDTNVILIGLLFIVGESLVRTGIAYQVSESIMRLAKNSEVRVLILLMLAVAGLGAFMSSTGVVAIFIPVVMAICRQMNVSPKRLMMPLSVAGLISGMMTLIATAPNLVANAELMKETGQRLHFFSFTPIGLLILLLGIGYMLLTRHWLGANDEATESHDRNRSINDLITEYQLTGRSKSLVIRAGSPLIGKQLDEIHLRSQYNINVLTIERWQHFRPVYISPLGTTELKEKDILLIDFTNRELNLEDFCNEYSLAIAPLRNHSFTRQVKSIGMAEITPSPESNALGKTVRDLHLRSESGINILGIKRPDEIISEKLSDAEFKAGDLMLVVAEWKQLQQFRAQNKDFFIVNYPTEVAQASPAQSQAPHAIFSILLMVLLMVTGLVPNVVAALIGCLLLGKFRCIDAKAAYEAIHWPTIILIVGMMPFSIALQKTGGVDLIVQNMLHLVGEWGHHAILASLFALCAIVGLFISNTATAVLMTPIAIALATQLHFSPVPFVMTIAIAASAAFMTPISSPVNTMVLGPGGYKFMDFVKIGIPFTFIVMLITIFVVPLLFKL
ncbi:di/tricarboxylate transporter [Cricetibacter osteomyelitidis]|uniref:Di/tricarboxylate transporter n=1 Tax=Cricetibacter osteomyelitidis TaxID=1521931 RepID=A0A4R2T5R8_9PAST|nr:SLC13 family permease [Cricetibacter osteomyelitidis]TCP96911.1 di/tricarboxylate transporter [Cricetibacter osteomyelitidis]